MTTWYESLQWVQAVLWLALAGLSLRAWLRRRDRASAWLAATFSSLGLVAVVGRLVNSESGDAPDWVTKLLIALLVLFPYFLYRFTLTFVVKPSKARWIVANGLTAGVIAMTFLVGDLPEPGAPRSGLFQVFALLIGVQWAYLLILVAVRLARAGKGQAPVARKRMRMMAAGAMAIAFAIVIAVVAPQSTEITPASLITQLFALLSGPLFLMGFAPPKGLRARWRRPEEADLQEVQISLVRAITQKEIADTLLPKIGSLLGSNSAVILDANRKPLAELNMSEGVMEEVLRSLPDTLERYDPQPVANGYGLVLDTGWLYVGTSPTTPFFGDDELRTLRALASLSDLALARAKAYELQHQATEAMREFVAIASHDLRTPATVIHGFAQVMQDRWGEMQDSDRRRYVDVIDRQTEHLNKLIDDLLTVSQVETGGLDIVKVEVDVREVVQEAAASLNHQNIEVRSSGSTIVMADKDHVRRMIENYLSNALNYGEPPIEVDVSEIEGWVVVKVSDHGSGVPDFLLARLFEKFARADKKKSKATHGTGLGLSIVRGLARANGGEAWYEPLSGGGACFMLRFPGKNQGRSHADSL